MKPAYYVTIINTRTNIYAFVKDFRAGVLNTQWDNYRLQLRSRHKAEKLIAELERYYAKDRHLEFKLQRVQFKGDSNIPLACKPFPKPKKSNKYKTKKKDKPWILPRRERQVIIDKIERKKEERRKELLKAEARRQASLELKPVNLNLSPFDSSKVDCRHCGICRACLERQSLL